MAFHTLKKYFNYYVVKLYYKSNKRTIFSRTKEICFKKFIFIFIILISRYHYLQVGICFEFTFWGTK